MTHALTLLEAAHWEQVTASSVAEADDRYLRAELLFRLGRAREASGWYGSMGRRFSYELVYLAPAQFRLGQIADRAGDRAAALGYSRRFLELWREPEPGRRLWRRRRRGWASFRTVQRNDRRRHAGELRTQVLGPTRRAAQ